MYKLPIYVKPDTHRILTTCKRVWKFKSYSDLIDALLKSQLEEYWELLDESETPLDKLTPEKTKDDKKDYHYIG